MLASAWQRRGLAACLLWPFSLLFMALAGLRRAAYRRGLKASTRLPVPVVVVGNITVGGSGKTPLVIALVTRLTAEGRRPGILSRGYRGRGWADEVAANADPAVVGDEPLLLARRTGVPVFVGADRAAAGRALLAAHPGIDVIVCDDGLQHYGLQRDVEVVTFDGRGTGNGWRLPAGPLREGVGRLRGVDAVVLSGGTVPPAPTFEVPVFPARLVAGEFYALHDPAHRSAAAALDGLRLHAVAGIADPGRFFATLSAMGLRFVPHPFPDHHAYSAADLALEGDALLATEKDAVKFSRLNLQLPVWILPVDLELPEEFIALVLEKLNGRPPA